MTALLCNARTFEFRSALGTNSAEARGAQAFRQMSVLVPLRHSTAVATAVHRYRRALRIVNVTLKADAIWPLHFHARHVVGCSALRNFVQRQKSKKNENTVNCEGRASVMAGIVNAFRICC